MTNLRVIAQADVRAILADSAFGAALSLTITNPSGNSGVLTGWSNDIGLLIDPDTGQAVSGRFATCAFTFLDLASISVPGIPSGIVDSTKKPWRVAFTNERGVSYTFKVVETQPDQTLGYIVCTLEIYK